MSTTLDQQSHIMAMASERGHSMPMPSDQRRRRIRCPKCTALLSEPSFPVFECPICATLLLAKGSPSSEVAENGNFAESILDGSLKQVKENIDIEQSKQDQIIENERKFEEPEPTDDSKKEVTFSDGNERIHNAPDEGKKNLIVSDNRSMPLNAIQAEPSSVERVSIKHVIDKMEESVMENGEKTGPSVDRKNEEKYSLADKEKEENDHHSVNVNGNGWNLKSKKFQDIDHELSFKYSLEGKDDHLHYKSQSTPKSELAKTDVSRLPLNTPLRVRLARCSDPTEDESCSSSTSDSESHNDVSDSSDFDFPAPSPDRMQAVNLPTPFIKKREHFYTNAGPHILEFRDPYGAIDNGNDKESSHADTDVMKGRVNQELARRQTNGGTNKSEKQQDNLQGAISGIRKLEIIKEFPESSTNESSTIDSTVVRSCNGTQVVIEKNERKLIDGNSQQIPGTAMIGKGKEINTQDMKNTTDSNADLRETKIGVSIMDQIQMLKTQYASHNLHCNSEIESQDHTSSQNVLTTSFPDGRNMPNIEVTTSSLTNNDANFLMQVLSSISGSKGKQPFFHNNAGSMLQPSPPRELRNLPEKLQSFDSEGRLICQAEKQENENMAYSWRDPNRSIATEDSYLQPVSAVESWDLYNHGSPSHSVHRDLYDQSPSGYPHNPLSNQVASSVSSPQRYDYANHQHISETYGTGELSENIAYPYQVSSNSVMVTMPTSEHAYAHHGYNRHCIHNEHTHMLPTQYPQYRLGVSRPTSLMMHQTGHAECLNYYNQGHDQTSFPSKDPQSYDALNVEELNSPASSSGRMYKHYPPLPKDGAPPYIICKACNSILEVPPYLPLKGVTIQKLRCGGCDKVSKFSTDYENKRPLLYGVTSTQPLINSSQQSRQLPVLNGSHCMDSLDEELVNVSHDQDLSKRLSETISNARSLAQEPQGGVTSTSHTTYCDTDASLSYGPKTCHGIPTVDEKEEGLDFGAPRISDGDSLESRTRSPENQGNLGDAELLKSDENLAVTQVQKSAQHVIITAQGKKEGSPLLVLLNQGSKKFNIDLESMPYEETKTSLVASTTYDRSTHWRHREIEARARSHMSLSRGPKYIAGLLRRSLRDIGKGQ